MADNGDSVDHGPVPNELAGINVESGVSAFTGEPFCRIEAVSTAGVIWFGQLPPSEVRGMAMQWIEAAEAAEQDAVVRSILLETGADDQAAAAFIGIMRAKRQLLSGEQ